MFCWVLDTRPQAVSHRPGQESSTLTDERIPAWQGLVLRVLRLLDLGLATLQCAIMSLYIMLWKWMP